MSQRLYVGNIPYDTTDSILRAHFSNYGSVEEVHIVVDRDSGRGRGFAFVTMDTEGAHSAVGELNDTEFGGRRLNVSEAKERAGGAPDRSRQSGARR